MAGHAVGIAYLKVTAEGIRLTRRGRGGGEALPPPPQQGKERATVLMQHFSVCVVCEGRGGSVS